MTTPATPPEPTVAEAKKELLELCRSLFGLGESHMRLRMEANRLGNMSGFSNHLKSDKKEDEADEVLDKVSAIEAQDGSEMPGE